MIQRPTEFVSYAEGDYAADAVGGVGVAVGRLLYADQYEREALQVRLANLAKGSGLMTRRDTADLIAASLRLLLHELEATPVTLTIPCGRPFPARDDERIAVACKDGDLCPYCGAIRILTAACLGVADILEKHGDCAIDEAIGRLRADVDRVEGKTG